MEIKKKKDEEKASVKVNQPIWRNSLQRISRNLPPKQQFKFPILKHSNNSQKQKTTLKYSSSHLNFSAQSGTWYRMQNVYHHISMETITSQNFQNELDSAQDESKGCNIESVLLWTNVAFKSKHFMSKLNPRLKDSSLIQKIIYMRENGLSPNIDICEHLRVMRDKTNMLRIKWIISSLYIHIHTPHTHTYIHKIHFFNTSGASIIGITRVS